MVKKRAKMRIYALKTLFLGRNTAIKVFFGRIICKYSDLSFDFGKNLPFFLENLQYLGFF